MVVRTEDLTVVPKEFLKPPRQRRSRYDERWIRELAGSIRTLGLMNPPECLLDGEIVSGEHRRQAILLIEEMTEVPVRIVSGQEAIDIRIRRISENLMRTDYSLEDKLAEVKGFAEDRPGITNKEIAGLLKVDSSTITRITALEKCVPEVRKVADEIGVARMYDLSKLPPEEQEEALTRLRDARAAKARKRNGDGMFPASAEADTPKPPKPKTSKPKATDATETEPTITVTLPGGKAVVVIGVDAVGDALLLLRMAAGYAKEWQHVGRERFEDNCRLDAANRDAKAAAKRDKAAEGEPVAAMA
jgi:ParB-like chromosome segregation protein Spo0J